MSNEHLVCCINGNCMKLNENCNFYCVIVDSVKLYVNIVSYIFAFV